MRDQLFEQAGGKLAFEILARKVFKHGPTAVMVRELLFWTGKKNRDPEGFVYITTAQWWEEHGLTYRGLKTARHNLGAEGFDVLEEKRGGVPCKLFYRLRLERLMEAMFPVLEDPPEEEQVLEDVATLNHDYRVTTSVSQELTERSVKSGRIDSSHNSKGTQQGSSSRSFLQNGADAPKNAKNGNADFHDDFLGDLEAVKSDLEALAEGAEDPEDLKKDADAVGYYFMGSHKDEGVTDYERRSVFAAVGAAKKRIEERGSSATTSFGAQPDPVQNPGSDEAVEDGPGVYVAASMGDALLQAIDEAEDDERRGFEKLLLQWQRARDKESAQRPSETPVTDADGRSLPAADRQAVQAAVLETVEEIKEF